MRPIYEGGKFSGSEKNRISIIKLIAEYNPFLLDTEFNALRKNKNLQHYLKSTGTNILVSWHNFKQTPDISVLKKKLLEMKKFSNNIKIVTMAKAINDLVSILLEDGDINSLPYHVEDDTYIWIDYQTFTSTPTN